jgi:hypothetical protein
MDAGTKGDGAGAPAGPQGAGVVEKAAKVLVEPREGEDLNGLGMMVLQYLEQDFACFPYKAEAARRIRCRIGMEVDKGVAITVSFLGERVIVENGVRGNPDFHMKAPYLLLSRVLCGKASPVLELLRGNIKLLSLPRRPIQSFRVLRLLKIEPGPLEDPQA